MCHSCTCIENYKNPANALFTSFFHGSPCWTLRFASRCSLTPLAALGGGAARPLKTPTRRRFSNAASSPLIEEKQIKTPPRRVVFLFGSPCWTRTNDTAVNRCVKGVFYRLLISKKRRLYAGFFDLSCSVMLCHVVSSVSDLCQITY
jgi:hypothetical protein